MKKVLLALLVLLAIGFMWGANLINENISTWTVHAAYGSWTQAITAGNVTMTNCIVSPAAAATGTCTVGRAQLRASDGVLALPALSSVGVAEFHLAAGGASRTIKLQKFNGTTWDDLTTFTGIGTTGATFTYAVNLSSSTTLRLSTASSTVYVHDIIIADYAAATPLITVNLTSLTNLNYNVGSGPSTEQPFTVSGTDLTADISLSAPTDYQISTTSGSNFGSSVTLNRSGTSVTTTTIYVQLKSGLSIGAYNSENITISSGSATTKYVACSGSVLLPVPGIPSSSAATAVSSEGFTAHWNNSSNASSYRLDVYQGSATPTELVAGFEGTTTTFPTDWTQNSSYVASNGAYAHGGTYYAGENSANDWIQTPIIENPNTLTFWTETSSTTANWTVKVQSSPDNSNWADHATYSANGSNTGDVVSTYSQKTVVLNLTGSYYIRWFMTARTVGSFYMDDVSITGQTGTQTYVSGFQDLTVNSTVKRVDGLNAGTAYKYRVRAYNATGYSTYSTVVDVTTAAQTSGGGANTSIGGAQTTILVPVVTGSGAPAFTNNNIIIDPANTNTGDVTISQQWTPTGYDSNTNTRLVTTVSCTDNTLLNGTYTINHAGLGFTPLAVNYKFGGSWNNIPAFSGDANSTTVTINGLSKGAKGDLIIGLDGEGGTLPVELSSFTAVLTVHNYVNLSWTTQSEINMSGFNVYRSNSNALANAELITDLIPATNSSLEQVYVYQDAEVDNNNTYYYWLEASELNSSSTFHGPVIVTLGDSGEVVPPPVIDSKTGIDKIYPNPFNPRTEIAYNLKGNSNVTIVVYNHKGQIIRTLVNADKTSGYHRIAWDGNDNSGVACASGVYFVKMQAGEVTSSHKLVLVK